MMDMEKMKQRIISSYINIGKKCGRLDRLCRSAFRKRLVCVWLVGIIFVTQTDLLSVFAETEHGTVEITGFQELSAEIAEQTVTLGTPYEELLLPEELIAYVVHREPYFEGNQEDETEADNSQGDTEDDRTPGITETGDNGEGGTTDNADTDGTGAEDITDGADTDGTGAEDITDGADTDSNVTEQTPDVSAMPQTSDIVPLEAETSTVTLPEYQSEHVVTVETLLQNPDSDLQSETPDNTEQESIVIDNITWKSAPSYNGDTAGEYIFTPELPDGYSLAGEGITLPTITVMVEQSDAKARRALARAAAADGTHQDHSGWTEMRSNTITLTSGNYYLTADMSNGVTIQSGATVNLCLNGYTLSVNSSIYEAAVTVESGATLNVYDCVGSGSIKYAYRSKKMPGIRTEGNVNVYGGTISGKDGGIQASGTAEVNLYGGIVNGEESNGIYLDSGTRLLIDGGEVRNKLTDLNNNVTGAVFMAQGSSAELRSGKVYAESVGNNVYNNRVMWILPDCRFTMSGGTLDYADEGSGYVGYVVIGVPTGMAVTGGDALVEITGGTVNCDWGVDIGELTVNDTEIKGRINLAGGVLKIQGSQPIGTALSADEPDIIIRYARNVEQRLDVIELTGPITNADGYTIQLSEERASSSYPITVTRGFSTYMSGKQPSDCFTYLKKDQRNDYKMVLSDGEVTLLPYVMTFDANGGTLAEDEKKGDITGGLYMRSLPVPTRDGYDFDGWYTEAVGGTEVTIDAMPHEDITVYAHWTPITYDITYDLAGGTLPAGKTNPAAYQIGSAAFTLNNPERTGYTFTGWSGTGLTGSANKTVTVAKGSMGERTYTANWKVNTYTVTLNGNGGSGTALTGYTYGAGATLPANWTKSGYTFGGWYANAAFTGAAVTSIGTGETGNKTYYAKWTPKQYTVTFDYQGATGDHTTQSKKVTYDSTYGTLPQPARSGYAFQGWYTQTEGKGRQIVSATKVATDTDHTLYACWKDAVAPDAPVLQSGITLPSDWSCTQRELPLVLKDNVEVTKLWVKIDNGSFAQVSGYVGDGASTEYSYALSEGDHTYTFKAQDAAGNESGLSIFHVKLDTVKPELGPLSYENKAATLWQWVIGRKSLIIRVPVSENGSGVSQIHYTMTPMDAAGNPDSSREEQKSAVIKDGAAEIVFPQDSAYQGFRGQIVINCSDLAGNAADSITVGMEDGASGVIVEDTAPVISVLADREPSDMTAAMQNGTALSEQYYETAPALLVTVADDTDNSIVAGIASVTYQIDEKAAESVTINKDAMKTTVSFTIPSSKIPAGVTTISIVAKDNAGNESAETYTLKVKGPERKPAARIDYGKEKLTNLIANAEYRINDISYIADAQGCVPIGEAWMGTSLAIVKCGNGSETLDSDEQSVTIPARPRTPSPTALDETGPNRKDGRLIGLDVGAVYRVSTDNGATWKEMTTNTGGVLTGLSPGSYLVQKAATATGFASKPSTSLVKVEAYRISVVFMVDGGEYTTVYTTYGESITEIPKVPQKPDAGTQKYIGEWCDAQGNPVDFTNIKADMTVYAVHTKAYAVTLQQGAGYRLTASSGNAGYVKEGDNCGFTFTLSSGYRKKADFAVKINGVKVELTGGGSYTITDVREDKTVTVEGIEQIPSASGNQGSGGSHSSGNNGDDSNGGSGNSSKDSSPGGSSNDRNGSPDGDGTGSDSPAGVSSSHGGNTSDNGNGMGTSKTTGGGNTTEGGRTETESSSSDRDGGTVRNGNQIGENAADRQGIPEGEEVLTVSASIENGRIIIPDNADVTVQAIPTGNAGGMANTSTILKLDDGAVVVTVICTEQECTAGVEDTVAVANAVLTQTHMELVSNGEIIEIRIDVKDISSQVPEQDKEIIESGIASYSEEIPDLTLGMYVDISMFVRAGQEDWQAVTQTAEPIAAVIGIPAKLREDSREYYIIRAHDGEYTLMEDMDDASDTITISTDRFSSYAIAWQETEDGGSRCRLCHICPTFLGICCFVWLAIAAAVILVVFVIMMRRRREEEGTEING